VLDEYACWVTPQAMAEEIAVLQASLDESIEAHASTEEVIPTPPMSQTRSVHMCLYVYVGVNAWVCVCVCVLCCV
jgi:hypothetical protein